MPKVAQVLESKNNTALYTIHPEASVREAIAIMAEKNIGALVVTDRDNHVVGMLSERDYTHKVALKERSSRMTSVNEIMTAHVFTATPQSTVADCLQIMTDRHLRHLPVIENDVLTGLVSIGDLVKATMEEQRRLIQELQQYISG